jgi:hypothetical protein
MFNMPREPEAYTNPDQQRENETPSYRLLSVFLPALLPTSYLALVTLISLSDFEHVNPTKRNGFYSAATMRMGPDATTNRFPQISSTLHPATCFVRGMLV